MIVNPILYQQGTKLPELTNPGAAADLLAGKQLVDQYGNPLTGTMPEVTQATPSISVSSSGLITASAVQDAGHVAAGTKSNTKQLTTQSGKTVTPGTSRQTAVASGRYTTGAVYVAGDANLVAGNIKSGVSIFGVQGTLNQHSEMHLCWLNTATDKKIDIPLRYFDLDTKSIKNAVFPKTATNDMIIFLPLYGWLEITGNCGLSFYNTDLICMDSARNKTSIAAIGTYCILYVYIS